MHNLADFEEYKGQSIDNASVLCWNKKAGYFFLTFHSYLLAMQESEPFKIVGVRNAT